MSQKITVTLIAIAAIAAITAAGVYFQNHQDSNLSFKRNTLLEQWNQFKQKFGKKYADQEFERYRIGVFAQNLEVIKNDPSFGITKFMDMTPQEFEQSYLSLQLQQNFNAEKVEGDFNGDIDWTQKGAVTPVKDQGSCGSCWAFSAIGAVESALILNGEDKSINLAEQELVDCATTPKYDNEGCNGGWMDSAFDYILDEKISQTKDYKYTARDGKCKDTSSFEKKSISGYKDIPQGDCKSLLNALSQQPIAIAVDASSWQFYNKGVLASCGSRLNHGVLLTGYVNETYKVKNSWGTSWGEKGFIQLKSGNSCGLCNAASYPLA
ncbi:hypothetical protein ABPG74_021223 [Tetrahymena malaccensis]